MSAGANDRVEELLSVLGEHHEVDCLGGERRGSDRDDPPVCQTNHLRRPHSGATGTTSGPHFSDWGYEGMRGREGCAVVACPATKEIESMSASTSTCRHVSQLASVSGTPSNPSLPSPASRQW